MQFSFTELSGFSGAITLKLFFPRFFLAFTRGRESENRDLHSYGINSAICIGLRPKVAYLPLNFQGSGEDGGIIKRQTKIQSTEASREAAYLFCATSTCHFDIVRPEIREFKANGHFAEDERTLQKVKSRRRTSLAFGRGMPRYIKRNAGLQLLQKRPPSNEGSR